MKRKVTYSYELSRNEVIAAVVKALGLPGGTVPESFNLESAALAEPASILWMTVQEESEREIGEAA